jgi:uncharacterized protein YndB with AHSA1/START domain
MHATHHPNALLDLSFERIVDVPKERVWRAWTEPALLMPWFCPLPWKTVECEIDLRPGGIFRTVMQSPEGRLFPGTGCILEVIPNERFTWTSALLPGFRPAVLAPTCGDDQAQFFFTATIALATHGSGTRYAATVTHADEAACQQHAAMGFHEGWGKALDQLVALVKAG